jgi:hypothetical protein
MCFVLYTYKIQRINFKDPIVSKVRKNVKKSGNF